jgi:hypothetical protein
MLARKLTLILLVVVSLAATTFGVLWTSQVLDALERRKIARHNTLALVTRIAVENLLKTGNVADLRRLVERLEKSREISVFLLDGRGEQMIPPTRPVPPLVEKTSVMSRARSVWLIPGRQRVRVHPILGADGNPVGKLAVRLLRKLTPTGTVRRLAPDVLDTLLRYDWPGNVRQLENVLERAVALTQGEEITRDELPDSVRSGPSPAADDIEVWRALKPDLTLEHVTQRYIQRVLEHTGGNRSAAAALLGIDRKTLAKRLV